MVEPPSTSEVTNFDQIDQSFFKEFFEKVTVWDFDNIWDFDSDLTISKANFCELTFCYINQGQVSLVKGGEQALYLEYIVCGQIMPIANQIRQLIWIGITSRRIRFSYMCRCISLLVSMVVWKKCQVI